MIFRDCREKLVKGLDDPLEPGLLAVAGVGAGVHDDLADAEPGAPRHFLAEAGQALVAHLARRGSEVDQVDVVGDDLVDSRLLPFLPEEEGVGVTDRLAAPLVGVLGEDLDDAAPCLDAAFRGEMDAAGDGHVRAEIILHGKPRIFTAGS